MFRVIRAFVLRVISEDVKYWSDLARGRGIRIREQDRIIKALATRIVELQEELVQEA
jgi:hypothetical protein